MPHAIRIRQTGAPEVLSARRLQASTTLMIIIAPDTTRSRFRLFPASKAQGP